MSLSRKAVLLGIVGMAVVHPAPVFSEVPAVSNPIDPRTQEQTEEKRKTLMADATAALTETHRALALLDAGKKKEALAALERASGKLDIILARDSSMKLAPTGVSVLTTDLQGGAPAASRLRQQAQQMLNEGRIQEARLLLRNLASETVISVANLPLATYPAAIKDAVGAVDADNIKGAKAILQSALDTQVLTQTTIPLPVVYAQESLREAETLSEKKDRTPDENARLKAALDKAREHLEFAQILGYGTKKDFDNMYQQLAEVQEKTSGNKADTGLYAKLKASISELLSSSAHSKS